MFRSNMSYMVVLMIVMFTVVAVGQQKKNSPEIRTASSFFAELTGDWRGSYSLWTRPGTPAQKSNVSANFQPVAKGNYFLMTYSWKRGDEMQEGVFLFGRNRNDLTATWGDSFHMVPDPMACKGEFEIGGKKLILRGSYSGVDGPAWGWRTEFTLQDRESLLMEAFNIMPNGVEALAVKAELRRVSRTKIGPEQD